MAQKYKAVLTKIGAAKIAAATAGGTKINLTQMAVGDGGGTLPTPDPAQTKLIAEKHRAALNKVIVDPKHKNYLVAELVIPPEIGGFWMRELGLYDEVGALIAVSNMAESYKPLLSEGSGRAQTLRMVVIVSDMDTVNLLIDSSTVLATQEYVDDKLLEHEQSRHHPDATLKEKGFTQLNSATNSDSEALAATPKAVKAAYDLASGKYTAQDATTVRKGIVQLNSAINSDIETQAATPKAVKAAYDLASAKFTAVDATTDRKGIVQLSSATDNASEALAATPKAVKIAMDNANARLAKDRNGADIPNATLFINNLGLRETVNKAASAHQDGSWGLGGSTTPVDFASIVPSGFVQGAGNSPIPGTVHFGINIRHQDSYALQFVGRNNRFFAQTVENKNFRGWAELFTSANKPTANDVEAWPIAVRGNLGNGTLLSSANQVGVYLVSIADTSTVSDFPKIGNTPLYGYGFMIVTKNGASINQLYMSHRGHIANRQSWNNETGYVNGWNIGYGTINKPTSSDVGALPIGGGTLNGNLIVNNQIQVGGVGTGIINIGDTDSGLRSSKDGQVDLYANGAFRGYWNTTTLGFTGQIIPTNYNNFDARYIQNTQMGAEEYVDIPYPGQASLPWGACPTAYVGTTKSTGSGISFHISRVYFRRLQKYIGGSWKNVA